MEVSGQVHAPATLPPGKETPVSLDKRLGVEEKNSQTRRESNSDHLIVQSVASCHTDWATVVVVVVVLVVVEVKIKLFLCFNLASRHGVLGKWRYSSTHSLTSALGGDEWSVSRPGRFTSRERAYGTHWIGGWMGPSAVLDAVVKRKIPSPLRESKPRTPIIQPVAQRYIHWTI
jgi:hypothetical protein